MSLPTPLQSFFKLCEEKNFDFLWNKKPGKKELFIIIMNVVG